MKLILAILLLSLTAAGQTSIERTFPVRAGQRVVFQLDHPEVKLQTWDKPEVLVKGTVSINKGEHDSAFQLDEKSEGTDLVITSGVKDKDKIPHRISFKKGEQEFYFKTDNFHDPEVQKFLAANGGEYSYRTSGILYDIKLEVFVPRNANVQVIAKYGLVEVSSFDGSLALDCKYGGADITFPSKLSGHITARANYGEIMTNLDTKFEMVRDGNKNGKRWTEITANLGSGPEVTVESKYGNIYLRKSK
jgi:hypothetical protein